MNDPCQNGAGDPREGSDIVGSNRINRALDWFGQMIPNCKDFAAKGHATGKPIVGIMCEFAPRELIMAAGAVPVCLCGGDADTIPAAETQLPSNLCPLIKSTYGYFVEKSNPFLEMADFVLAETTCDGKKKMFELMSEQRPTYLMELPQKADDQDAFENWVREMRRLKDYLEVRYGLCITSAGLRDTIRVMNRERGLRRRLADLMLAELPPLTGRQLIEFRSIISGVDADLKQYEAALELFAEGEAAPGSPLATGTRPVRVLLTGVPLVHGAERVLELIEDCGGLVVCMENCSGLKPILDDISVNGPNPLVAIARKYYHLPCSVMTPNRRRMDSLRALAAKYRPQCVIELVWQACITYDVEATRTRRLVEEQFGLPYLKITTDYSRSDSARITARIEALMETVRERVAAGVG